MRYFTRPLGPEPRRRTLSFAGFITKIVRLYRGASSSRKTLLRNLFREPFTVLARLASGPLVNSYHTDHKKGRAKKLSLFCGRGDGIRTHDLLVPNQARYHLRYASYPIIILFFAEVVN